jgi:opacity protein-like surface antigen
MNKIASIVFAVLGLFANSAFASNGRYFTLDNGAANLSASAFINPNCYGFTMGVQSSNLASDEAHFSTEFSYLMFMNANVVDTFSLNRTGTLSLAETSYQLAMVYALPVWKSGLDLTARGGVAYNSASITGAGLYSFTSGSASQFSPTYGVGLRYNFTDGFGINARYDYLGSFIAQSGAAGVDESRVSVGLQFSY